MQKVLLPYLMAFATNMPFKVTIFRYDCIIGGLVGGVSTTSVGFYHLRRDVPLA